MPTSRTAGEDIMATKITVIYDDPTDPAAFEAGYSGGVRILSSDVEQARTS